MSQHQLPGGGRIPVVAAFESTFLPGHGVDVAETSQHASRWRADLEHDLEAGVGAAERLRYALKRTTKPDALTMSFGVVEAPRHGRLPDDLLRLIGYARGAYALGYVDDQRDPIEVLRPATVGRGAGFGDHTSA